MKKVINNLANVQYRAQRAITRVYRATTRSTLQIETHSSSMHIYLDRMTSLIALKIAISSTYDIIVKNKFKKTSRIINLLEKLTRRLERKTNTSINNLKVVTSFAASP